MSETLPCPFCGDVPDIDGNEGSGYYIECICEATAQTFTEPTEAEAAARWNTRTAAPGMAWVATSEGLPEGAWPVLVAGNFYSVRQLVAWYCREMNGEPAHWESRGESWPVEQVTHWMELPPAPETGEGR